jgi:hypothetical protein
VDPFSPGTIQFRKRTALRHSNFDFQTRVLSNYKNIEVKEMEKEEK